MSVDAAALPDIDIHPACDLLPTLAEDEFAELADDIEENGLLEPVVVHDGQVLDGRHRLMACLRAGIEPEYRDWEGECGSPAAYVVSKNVHRRHLTASQRAMVAAELLPELEEEARERQEATQIKDGDPPDGSDNRIGTGVSENGKGEAREKAAESAGVSPSYVSDAKKVREKNPDLADDVASGGTTLPEAKRRIQEDEAGLEKLESHPLHDMVRTIVRQRGVPTDTARTMVDTASRMDDAESRQMLQAWETEDRYYRARVKARLKGIPPEPDPRADVLSAVVRELSKAARRFEDQFTEPLLQLRDEADTLREDINAWRSEHE